MSARRRVVVVSGVMIGLVGLAGLALAVPVRSAPAFQNPPCSDPPANDESTLVTITEPAGAQWFVTGPVPVTLGITITKGVIVYEAGLLTTEFRWGDGAKSVVRASPCGSEGEYQFDYQVLRHTYSQPGEFTASWYFAFAIESFPELDMPVAFVSVEAAATATPVPPTAVPPTATPIPGADTPTPVPVTATPEPGSSPGPSATATAPPGLTPSPAVPSPSVGTTASPRPGGTSTPTATSAAVPAGATGTPGSSAGSGDSEPPPPKGQPEIVRAIESPADVSTDPGVIATNIVIAGMTVWVFFSSVLLNQVLSDRRQRLEERFGGLTRPVRRAVRWRASGHGSGRFRPILEMVAVLVLTGSVYSFLQPGFKFDQAMAVLLVAAIVGSAGVTYACEGLEALLTRRSTGAPTTVRAYPLAIAIAVVSVLATRIFHLTPGVMYGLFASAVVLGPVNLDERGEGRLSALSVGTGLALALGAWLAVGPVRGLESDSFLALAAEATLVVIFIEGVETVAIAMVPLGVTDGGKIYRWNRWLWGGFVLAGAFMAWHILLGSERQNFSGLREAQSLTVVGVFAASSALSLGLWAWLRRAE